MKHRGKIEKTWFIQNIKYLGLYHAWQYTEILWSQNNLIFSYAIWFVGSLHQNLPGKLGQPSAICWNSLGLFRDYGLNYIFFRNKTFLFFKIESWNLKTFQLIQLGQTIFISIFSIRCLIELKFCEVSRNSFQTDSKSFSFLSWKTKKFYS